MPKPRERLLVVDLGARAETTEWIASTVGKGMQLVWARPFEQSDPAALDEFYADDWEFVTVCGPSYAVLRQALWAFSSFGRTTKVLIAVDEAPNLVRRLGPRRHSYPRLREARATDVAREEGPLTQLSFEF